MSTVQLLSTLALVAVSMLLSSWQRLKLEKEIGYATLRTFVQLLAIGYVLSYVFSFNRWYATVAILAAMTLIAAQNAARRGRGIPGVFGRVLLAIALGEGVTLALMLVLHIIAGSPRFLIPVAGMILGNCMVASGLVLNRLKDEIRLRSAEVEAALALGASPRQAIEQVLKGAVRSGMIPTIDSMKTVGLVSLPGMMTGTILAGADPLLAVRYQIMVMLMLSAATTIASISLAMVIYQSFFNRAEQLVLPHSGAHPAGAASR